MSVATLISCPEIQAQLLEVWANDPTIKREDLPLTELLLSPFNVGGNQLQKVVSPGNGKSRLVDLIYTPRQSEDDVNESSGHDDCTSSNVPTELSKQYDVGTDYLQVDRIMPMDQLRYKCEQDDQYMAKLIMGMMDQLGRKIETFNFEQLFLLKGEFSTDIANVGTVDGSDDFAVQTLIPSTSTFSFDLLQKVQTATKYSGYSMPPLLIGGAKLDMYLKAAQSGCCAASGINIEAIYQQYGMAAINSYRADNAFGSSLHFLSIEPGAVQLIYWNEYEGIQGINTVETEIYKQTILVDPKNGMKYDFKANMDCNGKWSFFLRSYTKLVGLPNDMYSAADRLEGVTFVNGFLIANT